MHVLKRQVHGQIKDANRIIEVATGGIAIGKGNADAGVQVGITAAVTASRGDDFHTGRGQVPVKERIKIHQVRLGRVIAPIRIQRAVVSPGRKEIDHIVDVTGPAPKQRKVNPPATASTMASRFVNDLVSIGIRCFFVLVLLVLEN